MEPHVDQPEAAADVRRAIDHDDWCSIGSA
jgi:hypothetical protein